MKTRIRGGPAQYDVRRRRALALINSEPATRDLLSFLAAVLAHQQSRTEAVSVRNAADRLLSTAADGSQLDLDLVADVVVEEVAGVLSALLPLAPASLAEAARETDSDEVGAWIAGAELATPQAFFVQAAAAPIVELAAARLEVPPVEKWQDPVCPGCRARPRLSLIGEESGEFMRGSPRYLICGRCAMSWGFPRAVCPGCAENHPNQLAANTNERWPWARVDACRSCESYIKTFDLRQPGGGEVVPLVDDIATLALDLWALDRGLWPNHQGPPSEPRLVSTDPMTGRS